MRGKGKPFTKGKKPGPGRPKGTGGLKEIKAMNAKAVALKLEELVRLPLQELEKMEKDKTMVYLDSLLIKIALTAQKTGDVYKTNFILERMIGKVPDKFALTDGEGNDLPQEMDLSKLSTEDLKTLRKILPDVKKTKDGDDD